MSALLPRDEFLRNLSDSGIVSSDVVKTVLASAGTAAVDGQSIAQSLIAAGELTPFQAEAVNERNFNGLVIGNYVILDKLGVGGMGTVYKARHRRMKRVVAIKVLSKQVAESPRFVQRFQREVEAVARLAHPNIVMAFDADEAQVGHFLVMEFVNGRDLDNEVKNRGPLPVSDTVDCMLQAARALDYAHGLGIIHRDIKPANLLRDVSGVVKVADLGLARFNDTLGKPVGEAGGITQAGTIMGTVDYMPPEQALGLTTIDHRADIYSLGCTLYFLLNGEPVYVAPTLMAILLKHRDAPIPSLREKCPEAPAGLDQLFQRMIAKKPEDRIASMKEVIQALEAVPVSRVNSSREPVGAVVAVNTVATSNDLGRTIDLPPSQPGAGLETAILLVEPSRTQQTIIRKYLEGLGYTNIATAASGQKALEAARKSVPGVVISTMHLPDMTGMTLAQDIRAAAPRARIGFVLITSQDDRGDTNLLLQATDVVLLHKPFDAAKLSQTLAAAAEMMQQAGSLHSAESLRVLVADDSKVARIQIRDTLNSLGVKQITEVEDGVAAKELLEQEKFDLVVTDYNMPRLDGRGLIDFIRHHSSTPNVPVIMVTTETDPAKLDAVRQLGVSAMCDKSFKLEVVHAVMAKLR